MLRSMLRALAEVACCALNCSGAMGDWYGGLWGGCRPFCLAVLRFFVTVLIGGGMLLNVYELYKKKIFRYR
jgi:hypothetical protein